MLIWLGVVGTVLALSGIAGVFLLLAVTGAARDLIAVMQRCTDALRQSFTDLPGNLADIMKDLRRALDDQGEKSAAVDRQLSERAEASLRELLSGIKTMAGAWKELSQEIRLRYNNYEVATKNAERTILAIEWLQKISSALSQGQPLPRRPPGWQVTTDEEAADKEREMSDADQRVATLVASGLDRPEDLF